MRGLQLRIINDDCVIEPEEPEPSLFEEAK